MSEQELAIFTKNIGNIEVKYVHSMGKGIELNNNVHFPEIKLKWDLGNAQMSHQVLEQIIRP